MCRQCCRSVCLEIIFSQRNFVFRAKSRAEILDCPTHKMFKKTLTERAKQKKAEEKNLGVEGGGGGGDEVVVRTEG